MKEKEVMNARNTVDGTMAECQVIWDGEQYNFLQAISLHTEFRIIRDRRGRPKRWAGSGIMRFHYNDSVLRRIIARSKECGGDIYFDMLVTNENPVSQMGRQTVLLKGCCIDSGTVSMFDAESRLMVDTAKFTFRDFEFKESFRYIGPEHNGRREQT